MFASLNERKQGFTLKINYAAAKGIAAHLEEMKNTSLPLEFPCYFDGIGGR